MADNSALLLFSGGQDSATCLMWAVRNFDVVHTLGFSYGQRHSVELECRLEFLSGFRTAFPELGMKIEEDTVIDLSFIGELGVTSLTQNVQIESPASGLPNTFVPGRNIFFITTAASVAYHRDISNLIGGMCETDFSGYPDCRQDTIVALQDTLKKGMGRDFIIHTPLMNFSKSETWALAEEWGGMPLIELLKEFTHTCYLGSRERLHRWGYGCSECPACLLRIKGYEQYMGQRL